MKKATSSGELHPTRSRWLIALATLHWTHTTALITLLGHLPSAVALQKRANVAGKWASRANNALRRRSYMSTLETLRAESAALTVGVPQLALEVVERVPSRAASCLRP